MKTTVERLMLGLVLILCASGVSIAQEDSLQAGVAPLYRATKEARAADFELQDREGNVYRLSDHRGKVILLNFWATWCGPCREEIPDLKNIYADWKDKGLSVVGVALDEQGWKVVRPYAGDMKINYPVVVDDGSARDAYGPFTVVPTTYIIGREGLIRYYAPGRLNEQKLRPVLKKLLDEPRPKDR